MLHEKLHCYRKAVEMAEALATLMEGWPRGYGYLSDQIKRAMASCVLNISEGNARRNPLERKRFFQIARASVAEVGACLDLMRAYRLVSPSQSIPWKGECHTISKMLYGMR